MTKTELAELHKLATRYYKEYGDQSAAELLIDIDSKWRRAAGNEPIPTNTRGAGRKAVITAEVQEEVRELHAGGWPIRSIVSATGLSIGSVHKIISEQFNGQTEEEKPQVKAEEPQTRVYIWRAPTDSPAHYVAVNEAGDLLFSAVRISDITKHYKLIDSRGGIEIIRQLDKTWKPKQAEGRPLTK